MLVGLDIHNEYHGVVFYFLHGWLGGEGEFDDGIVVRFVSPRGALPRIFGLLLSRSVLGRRKVGDVWIFFFL